MDSIKRRIAADGRWLCVDEHGGAKLLKRASDSKHASPLLLVDLKAIVVRFEPLIAGRVEFNSLDLQTIAGVSYRVLNQWVDELDLRPVVTRGNERFWDTPAAFAVGLAASLRRFAQPLPVVKNAVDAVLGRTVVGLARVAVQPGC